jgi:hypothetical protein
VSLVSALIASEPGKDRRWGLGSLRERQRLGQVADIALGLLQIAGRPQTFERTLGHGRQDGHGPAAVGDLDAFAALDPPQQLARALPKLSYSHASHVLVVAHSLFKLRTTSCHGSRRARASPNGLRSISLAPSVTHCATDSPIAAECLKPCPEQADTIMTASCSE